MATHSSVLAWRIPWTEEPGVTSQRHTEKLPEATGTSQGNPGFTAVTQHQPTPLPETPGHSWASLSQSLVGSLFLSPGSWCALGFVCALQESISPVLCKFCQLYGGVNGDLLQEGLLHSHSSDDGNSGSLSYCPRELQSPFEL